MGGQTHFNRLKKQRGKSSKVFNGSTDRVREQRIEFGGQAMLLAF